ncbi:hypothetical protein [Flagellimonas allohymeniacidonis]|uniref:Uncharacterized protein n=1 Tax=Flagellimonas allohymeniacidonis TaxID=2517819 RepID=A0A4Q8QI67_9FLAO|nr:hypothetical protein [Allomuricauda hymeniacidonis]TAI49684.1 hypothetical protein EW142_07760 [Allomuricauda hymeniacidonis]
MKTKYLKSKLLLAGLLVAIPMMGQLPNKNFTGTSVDPYARGGNPALDFIFQQFRNVKPSENGLEIEGSPYFQQNFKKASIISNDGLDGSLYVRYDGYSDEIQIKENPAQEEIQALLRRQDIHCVLDGTKISYNEFYDRKGRYREGYLFTKVEMENMTLYERRMKFFKEGKEARTSLELEVPNRFTEANELYVGIGQEDGQKIQYLKPSKKEILKLMENNPEKASLVKRFMSDKALNVREASDVIQVFMYYNTL